MQKNKNIVSKYRIFLYLLILMFIFTTGRAQLNYVQNPSFEQYSRCPYTYDQIKFANYWSPIDTINHPPTDSFGDANCTPEYCNECAGSKQFCGVPSNGAFNHYCRTGKGMAQIMMYYDDIQNGYPYQRDYLQGRLYTSLIAGKSYCVTFYVCFEPASAYFINNIGAFLDNGNIDTTQNCGLPQTMHIPQVSESQIIYDSINWTKVENSFIATGNEDFITIGNFFSRAQTLSVFHSPSRVHVSWYLVDDVCVVESDIPAYAGGKFYKQKFDSVFIGRDEILPGCYWYRNGVLIDTVHAGFWVKDTVNSTYVVMQDLCGLVKYDTAYIIIPNLNVTSVSNESVYKIYPNPIQHEINIQAPNNISTAAMSIYDMNGRVMMRQEVHFLNGIVKEPLNLPGGVYVMELIDSEGRKNIQRLSVL